MSRTLRWVFVLLPCVPGLTLLAAGLVVAAGVQGGSDAWRVRGLFEAGGAVLVAGVVIGAFVAWRIAHPRPDPAEDEEANGRPPTE